MSARIGLGLSLGPVFASVSKSPGRGGGDGIITATIKAFMLMIWGVCVICWWMLRIMCWDGPRWVYRTIQPILARRAENYGSHATVQGRHTARQETSK